MTVITSEIETLINQGRFFEARVLSEGQPPEPRILQLLALAMNKSGLSEPARNILEPLYQHDNADPETAGILGSIYKRLFRKTQDNQLAALAKSTYLQNFLKTRNYYTGINSAAMAVMCGRGSEGRTIASEVIAMLNPSSDDFWEQATLGEAWLISRDKGKAAAHYLLARKLAGKEWGKLQSVHDQLLLLNFFIAVPPDLLKAFAPPAIIAFTGHMIDQPDRAQPRFPSSIEKQVHEGIRSAIRTIGASIGYTSLSCGSDILFAEAMAETGGEVHLFLPFDRADYLRESVGFAGDHWIQRFEQLEKKFPVTYVTHEPYTGNDDLFSFQNRIILGTVCLRAAMSETKPTLLTVLSDTDLRQKEGGTRDTLATWPYKTQHINVNPDDFLEKRVINDVSSLRTTAQKRTEERLLFYILIADLSGATANDEESFFNFCQTQTDHLLLKPALHKRDTRFIAAFTQPVSAMELVKGLSSYKKAFGQQVLPRISMHTHVLDSHSLSGAGLSEALQLHTLTPPGIPSAYGWFAAASTLSSDNWIMEFAGIAGGSFQQPNEIYRVTFRK